MQRNFAVPVAIMFLTLLLLMLFIWGIPLFAGIPLNSATDSANLVSYQVSLSASLPWFATFIVAGIVAFAVKLSGVKI